MDKDIRWNRQVRVLAAELGLTVEFGVDAGAVWHRPGGKRERATNTVLRKDGELYMTCSEWAADGRSASDAMLSLFKHIEVSQRERGIDVRTDWERSVEEYWSVKGNSH